MFCVLLPTNPILNSSHYACEQLTAYILRGNSKLVAFTVPLQSLFYFYISMRFLKLIIKIIASHGGDNSIISVNYIPCYVFNHYYGLHQYYNDIIRMTLVLTSSLNKKHFILDSTRAFFFELFTPCCVPFLLNL